MDKDIQPISFNKIDGTLILPENTTVVTREMIEPYRDSVTKIVMPNGVSSIGDLHSLAVPVWLRSLFQTASRRLERMHSLAAEVWLPLRSL